MRERRIDVLLYDLSKHVLPLFDGEDETWAHPEVKHLLYVASQAEGFFVCTPEYHNGMSGALKNALDYLNRSHFEHKPVSIAAIAGGGKGGINALNNLRLVIRGVGGLVLSDQCIVDQQDIGENGEIKSELKQRLRQMVEELVQFTSLLKK